MADLGEALSAIDEVLRSRLPIGSAPGAVVALTDRQVTLGVVATGLADLARGEPMHDGARFQIGSISKSFAAIVALQEHDAGRLDLHAPVTDYVPWFEVGEPLGTITSHHLLTHTSGLVEGMEVAEDAPAAVWTLRDTACGFPPGERFHYSNAGYKLLGLVLEALTGRPIRDLLRERIFGPLGMRETEGAITTASYLISAVGHRRARDDRPPHRGQPIVRAPAIQGTTADGSIISTAGDMAAYARMLLNRGEHPGGRLVSEASFALLTRPAVDVPDEPGTAYAYGLDVAQADGHPTIGHGGGMVGFTSLLVCDMDCGLGAVMLLNGSGERRDVVRFALAALRAGRTGEPLPKAPPPPDLLEDPEAYAGEYRGRDGAIRVVPENGRLRLEGEGVQVTLERLEGDAFAVPHPALDRFPLRFTREVGRVLAVTHGPAKYVREGLEHAGAPDHPPEWEAVVGHYRSHNPWVPGFRVYLREGELFLGLDASLDERRLEPLGDGRFRVGEAWHPDRVRFEAIIEGTAAIAVYNGVRFYRTFVS